MHLSKWQNGKVWQSMPNLFGAITMTSAKTKIYRPCLKANHVELLHSIIASELSRTVSTHHDYLALSELFILLTKEKAKIAVDIGEAYTHISTEDRIRNKSVSITDLTSDTAEIVAASDAEKIAALSPMDEEIFWLEQELEMGIISKLLYDTRKAAITEKYNNTRGNAS